MMHKNRMVKESFDTLPTAIFFFDRNGLVRLTNRRMLAVTAILREGGIQSLGELRDALAHPPTGVQLRNAAAQVYRMPDGTILRFAERQITDKNGLHYTEVTAADVSELAALHAKLKQENERLADANRRAKRLYDTMPDLVREEEILTMKMQVHDDVGHTLLSARRVLRSGETLDEIRSKAAEWERSIALLCHNKAADLTDPLAYAQERAAALGAQVYLTGDFPTDTALRRLMALAIRECTSNCVRHTGGNKVYAACVWAKNWRLTVTNNGTPPVATVAEGGGLSALRRRVENAGGMIQIDSTPAFALHITLPGKENGQCPVL